MVAVGVLGLAAMVSVGCGRTDLVGGPAFDEGQCASDGPCVENGVFPGPCTESYDEGADGEPEQCSSYEYDDRCLVVRAARDYGCDGLVDVDESYTYDDRGLRTGERRFYRPDWVESWLYVYDAHDALVIVEADHGDDGVVDYRIEYDRDGSGRVLAERAFSGSTLTSLTITTYDAGGHLLAVEDHQHFCDDELVFTGEVVSLRTVHVRHDTEHLLVLLVDGRDCEVADGVVDMRIEQLFDGDGHLTAERVDGGSGPLDGVDDSCTFFLFDEQGRLVKLEKDGASSSTIVPVCDGVADYSVRHVYDEDGLEVRLEQDVEADGQADLVTRFHHDPCGNLTGMTGLDTHGWDVTWRTVLGFGCWEP